TRMNYGGKLTRLSSPSPRARGRDKRSLLLEGRDEGLYPRIRTRGETPHPNPLPARAGRRSASEQASYGGRSRAAIQASARYAASITASNPTTVRLPPKMPGNISSI